MRWLAVLTLSTALNATSQTAAGSENICDFSSPKDFMADEGAVFPVKGIRLDFHDGVGFNAYRAFVISPCSKSAAVGCFSAAYFSFGLPKTPISIGDSWMIASETYSYEQNIEVKVFGRSESFGVVSRSVNGMLKSKFLVNDQRGLAGIMFYDEDGRSTYQLYLQGNSCRPFAIELGSSPAPVEIRGQK